MAEIPISTLVNHSERKLLLIFYATENFRHNENARFVLSLWLMRWKWLPLCGWQHFRKLVHIFKSWFITLNIEITIRSVIMPQRQNEKDWFVWMQKLSQLNWHTFNYYNSRWQKIYLNISCSCICGFCGGIAQFPSYSGWWRGMWLFIPHRW